MSTIHDVNRRLHCGQTGPLDLLALGASHPHIAVVAVAADVITAAGVGDRVRGGFLYKLGVVSYTIRILVYPACILHVS